MNMLDVPLLGSRVFLPVHDVDDGAELRASSESNYQWNSNWPDGAYSWALLGSQCAVSQPHVDAGGFATYLEPAIGSKIWLIATERADVDYPVFKGLEVDRTQYDWHVVYLRSGDGL